MQCDWNKLSPYVRFAQDSYIKYRLSIINRTIFDFELIFLKEGSLRVEVGGETCDGITGDIFFLRPGQPHSIHFLSLPHVRQAHVHFDFFYDEASPFIQVSLKPVSEFTDLERTWIREDVTATLPIEIPTRIRLQDTMEFDTLLSSLIHASDNNSGDVFTVKCLFMQLWACLWKNLCPKLTQNAHPGTILATKAREYLLNHLSESITLDQAARALNVSKYHLVKVFSNAYDEPPMHFHTRKRIELANHMLLFSGSNVAEVAAKMGFHTAQAFSRTFKINTGISPHCVRRLPVRYPLLTGTSQA